MENCVSKPDAPQQEHVSAVPAAADQAVGVPADPREEVDCDAAPAGPVPAQEPDAYATHVLDMDDDAYATQLMDEADVEKDAAKEYDRYKDYRTVQVDSDDEEEEGMPAKLVVDREPNEYGDLVDVDAWKGMWDRKFKQRRGLHRGWYPLAQQLLTKWDEAVKLLGRVRLFTHKDFVGVEAASHAGSFGAIFTARLHESNYPVFIKGQPLDEQFAYELATLIFAYNQDVPIPAIIGLYRVGNKVYTVQAQSKGVPADQWFNNPDEPRTPEDRVRFAHLAAWELSVAHRKGVLHNDIALRNFLCGENGSVELIDFGLSVVQKLPWDEGDEPDPAPYIHKQVPLLQSAPEVQETGMMSRAADVFQFGWMVVSLFEEVPEDGAGFAARHIGCHRGDRKAILQAMKTQRPSVCPAGCPAAVWELALRCLDPEPSARPSMQEAAQELEQQCAEGLQGLAQCGTFRDACLWAIKDKQSEELLTMLLDSCGTYTLNLRGQGLNDEHIEILATALATNTALTTLDLRGTQVTDAGASALAAALATNTTLMMLDLRYAQVGDAEVAALATALATNTALTMLDLRYTQVGDAGVAALATALETNTALMTLDLYCTQVGYAGIAALATALATNTTLTTLNLRGTQVGDAGATVLAMALATNTALTTLNLSFAEVGDTGASALAWALATNTTLTTLNLYGNQVGDAGAAALGDALATNATLTALELYWNQVGEELKAALKEQHGDRILLN